MIKTVSSIEQHVTSTHDSLKKVKPLASPFLRWVGGKQQLVNELVLDLPTDCKSRRYVEPFIGAGALFFALGPRSALLSDANHRLINTYQAIKFFPDAVRQALIAHIRKHSSDYYYEVRDRYNECHCASPHQAARFIYLNKACFNGIYRVNTKGMFNVPIGSKSNLGLPSCDTFQVISNQLSHAGLVASDYRPILDQVHENDFVYLDPPYPALNDTAYFSHYTKERFDSTDQSDLALAVRRMDALGAKVLISNADLPEIRSLYEGFEMRTVPVKRYVHSKGVRISVGELIIRNY